MNPYASVICPRFVRELPHLTSALDAATGVLPAPRTWVFYGSRPLGVATATSDLDCLLVHDEDLPPERIGCDIDGVPVTVYALSRAALAADGRQHAFGGYFALKLFSPFVLTGSRDVSAYEVTAVVARFLAPLIPAGPPDEPLTADELLATCYQVFLDLYPDFDSYLARSLRHPRWSEIWSSQAGALADALRRVGAVEPAGRRYLHTASGNAADLALLRARATARFWAFGAVSHGADPGFPDFYFAKAESATSLAERQAARHHLANQSARAAA